LQDSLLRQRQEVSQRILLAIASESPAGNQKRPGEFSQNLTTGSTRDDWSLGVGDDREGCKIPLALVDRPSNANPFRAHCETKRNILDVAAGDYQPRFQAERGSYEKA
jgi:hypothetical protein